MQQWDEIPPEKMLAALRGRGKGRTARIEFELLSIGDLQRAAWELRDLAERLKSIAGCTAMPPSIAYAARAGSSTAPTTAASPGVEHAPGTPTTSSKGGSPCPIFAPPEAPPQKPCRS